MDGMDEVDLVDGVADGRGTEGVKGAKGKKDVEGAGRGGRKATEAQSGNLGVPHSSPLSVFLIRIKRVKGFTFVPADQFRPETEEDLTAKKGRSRTKERGWSCEGAGTKNHDVRRVEIRQ